MNQVVFELLPPDVGILRRLPERNAAPEIHQQALHPKQENVYYLRRPGGAGIYLTILQPSGRVHITSFHCFRALQVPLQAEPEPPARRYVPLAVKPPEATVPV